MTRFDDQAAWLKRSGIDVPAYRIARTAADVSEACRFLRYPLVAKPVPESASHKTELGLVHLRLRDADAVMRAVADIWHKVPGAPILVQEMVEDIVEVLLAMRMDADFGPVAAIGTGGVAVELHDDVAYLALPASPAEFRRALHGLKVSKLLSGYRGQSTRDIEGLALAASRLGDAFLGARERISEFEINPLGVRGMGGGVIALDVLEVATVRVVAG